MTSKTGAWLEDLTWQEAKARFDGSTVVVVPAGAASKAHGPHLPLKTDALTARALAQRLIERLPVMAAPVLDFGIDPAADSFKTLMRAYLSNLQAHGAGRIAIVNVGGDAMAGELGDVEILHVRDLDRTSVMLALDPRSVRMDRLTPDATQASAFKGERLLEAIVENMVATLARRWPDAF